MKILIAAFLFLLVRSDLHAYLIAGFPGLSELINKADAVVILRIDETLRPTDMSTGYGTHRCYIYQTLKGEIRASERVTLQLMNTGGESGGALEPYSLLSTHLVFLTKKRSPNEPTDYRTIEYLGANLRLSPYGNEKMPAGETTEEKIRDLIRRSTDFWDAQRRKELELLTKILK